MTSCTLGGRLQVFPYEFIWKTWDENDEERMHAGQAPSELSFNKNIDSILKKK